MNAPEVDFWDRYRTGWHLMAAASVVLVSGFALVDLPRWRERSIVLAVLAAILVWYALVGAPTLKEHDERRAMIYFAGIFVLLNGVYPITMAAAYLLFMFNPQLFTMIHGWRLRAVVMVVLYGEIAVWTLIHAGFTPLTLVLLGLYVAAPMVFSVLIGMFIEGIITQSRQRADLIGELLRTRAELAAERHDAGVYAERERLASEIHDTLAQGFTSILMLTQAARVGLDRSPEGVGSQLDLIERAARENLAEARALVAALAPPDLAENGLAEALGRLAERHTRDTGVPVSVSSAAFSDSLPGADVIFLRAAQEALANVRKHASAAHIRIEYTEGQIAIIDDGCGFDPATAREGYGLPGLRNRAAAYGGTATVSSVPGAGTTVRVTLPSGPT
jgi:signal transduction histidine kinase